MSEEKLTQGVIMKAMDWAYDKAVNGVPGLDSASEMASDYLKGSGSLVDKANSLIRWQNAMSATSGFVTGLGGLLLLPVTLPASITSILYVQLRMIAAIAVMGGYDVKDDRVKTLAYCCLVASSAAYVVRQTGMTIGQKLAVEAIKGISRETINKINQKVGFRLLTKFGEKGVVNLSKAVPVFSSVFTAVFDSISTNTVGNIARDTFIGK